MGYKTMVNDSLKKSGLKMLEGEELLKLQQAMLVCAQEIHEVCRKHHLKLILQGGSLLGAVRHGGFIPWDDDMDFAMMRKDYEKFKRIFEKELGDKYRMSVPNGDGTTYVRFMQLYRKDTTLLSADDTLPPMIKIDIFPIDYVSNHVMLRVIKGLYCNGLMFIAECVRGQSFEDKIYKDAIQTSLKGRFIMKTRTFVGTVFSYRNYEKWYDKVDKAVQGHRKTNYVTSATGSKHYLGEIVSKDVFVPCSVKKFAGVKLYAPGKPEIYLENLYGKHYMAPPPKDKREGHYVKKIDVDRILEHERINKQ